MAKHPQAGSEKRRVLVIDDDELTRATICSILEAAGFEVHQAENGERGLTSFQECAVDLVITDILMPDKEGIETILELRKQNEEVVIIAVSGGGTIHGNEILEIAQKLGADEVLPKPFSKAGLLEMVQKCLGS